MSLLGHDAVTRCALELVVSLLSAPVKPKSSILLFASDLITGRRPNAGNETCSWQCTVIHSLTIPVSMQCLCCSASAHCSQRRIFVGIVSASSIVFSLACSGIAPSSGLQQLVDSRLTVYCCYSSTGSFHRFVEPNLAAVSAESS